MMLELMNHRSLTSTDRHSMTKKAKAKGSQVRPRGMDRLARAAPTMEAPTTKKQEAPTQRKSSLSTTGRLRL